MTEGRGGGGGRDFRHLIVTTGLTSERYRPRGGGSPSKRYTIRNPGAHGRALTAELQLAQLEAQQAIQTWPEDLRSRGLVLAVTGWPGGFELALESLDLRGRDIQLLSVRSPQADEDPEVALVFVPFERIREFFTRLQQYETLQTATGKPRNEALVGNISAIRLAAIREMWNEPVEYPGDEEVRWWEVWLRRTGTELEALQAVATASHWVTAGRAMEFSERTVTAVLATGRSLGEALSSQLPLAEIRAPRLVQTPVDLSNQLQTALAADLAGRIEEPDRVAPAVCVLDTGIYRHSLFRKALDSADIYSVITADGTDRHGHGTEQAGLALFGSLEDVLTAPGQLPLEHHLESVKILPGASEPMNTPETYASVTAAGAVAPELDRPDRKRIWCFANTNADAPTDGRPTSWSATIDALAFGTDVESTPQRVELLSEPRPDASRLFVLAAGNVRDFLPIPYLDACDLAPVEDPAQAWNALTVGAFTDLGEVPDATFAGYGPLANSGDLSPFSRTSRSFSGIWPVKPDIVLEGGNILVNAAGSRQWPPSVCLTTTSLEEPAGTPFTATNATSAATAQAAHIAAVATARYPELWPETIRALMVQAAEWTEPMLATFNQEATKAGRFRVARRYGFGVPTLERVLRSAGSDVTLVTQASILPFELSAHGIKLREMHLHELPWPQDLLRELQETPVRLKVTLSYFVEPNPSARGWRGRYVYPSHQFRFDMRRPTESTNEFRARLNAMAVTEETGAAAVAEGMNWFFGPTVRNRGSLHADLWEGTAAELADSGLIGVYPVSGWWKNNNRRERADTPVRYALTISLSTPAVGIDLYTPIANQIAISIAAAA